MNRSSNSPSPRLREQGLHLVTPLVGDTLREAIEQPARQAGLRLQDGLTDLLVRDAEGEPGALPLLSHALAETWVRRDGHVLTVQGYRASGGIRGAVARTAEQLYDALPPGQRLLLRSVLLRLVVPSADGDPVRSRVPSRALLGDPVRERVVTLLVRSRLVTSEADTFELAHEALTKAWPRLRGWLDDDAEGHRIWRHITVTADSWDVMGRPDSELYRGTRLDRAIEWRNRAMPDLNDVERDFLDASGRAADAQRRVVRRRRATLISVLASAAAVATILGSIAVVQADRATSERDRARAAEEDTHVGAVVNSSLALRSTDRAAAALLAVEAYRRAPGDARAHSALLGTFTAAPGFVGYRHLPVDSGPLFGAMIPDSSTAVVAVDGHELHILNLDTGEMENRFPPGADTTLVSTFSIVRISDDARYVAHLVPDEAAQPCFQLDVLRLTDDAGCGTFSVYDVSSGQRVLGPITPPFGPGDIAINADGSLVAVAGGYDGNVAVAGGYDGNVAVYRTADGQQLGTLAGLPRPDGVDVVQDTATVTFGTDGRLYSGSMNGPIRVVEPTTLDVVDIYDAPPMAAHNNLLTTPNGLVVGSGDENLVATAVTTGAVQWSVNVRAIGDPFPCPFLAVSAPRERFYCGNSFGVLEERDLATGQLTGVRLDPQVGSVGNLAIAADGNELIAFGEDTPVISRWRLDGNGPIVDAGHQGWLAESYDPSGRLLVVTRSENVDQLDAVVVDPATGDVIDELDDIDRIPFWVTPELLGAAFTDGTAGLYDVRAHARVGTLDEALEFPGAPAQAWVSAAGTRIYLSFVLGEDGSDHHCQVWSIDLDTLQRTEPTLEIDECDWVESVSTTADGTRMAVTYSRPADSATVVYDGRTGEQLGGPLLGPLTTNINPDGTLVGGGLAGQVTHYDLSTLDPIGTFPGARGAIGQLRFSADGTLLMAGSRNQILSIYDVATRTRLGDPIVTDSPFDGPKGELRPDGKAVAINEGDGFTIWNIDPDNLADAACSLAGRNLTTAEWDTHLGTLGDYRATCQATPDP